MDGHFASNEVFASSILAGGSNYGDVRNLGSTPTIGSNEV